MWNPESNALLQHAGPPRRRRDLRGVLELMYEDAASSATLPRPCSLQAAAGGRVAADRRDRAGQGDRQALLDRAMSLGSLSREDARDAGDRDEPPRRALQHREGGEDPSATRATRTATPRRSAIKQSPPAASA
jgi:hypothetical protein